MNIKDKTIIPPVIIKYVITFIICFIPSTDSKVSSYTSSSFSILNFDQSIFISLILFNTIFVSFGLSENISSLFTTLLFSALFNATWLDS